MAPSYKCIGAFYQVAYYQVCQTGNRVGDNAKHCRQHHRRVRLFKIRQQAADNYRIRTFVHDSGVGAAGNIILI